MIKQLALCAALALGCSAVTLRAVDTTNPPSSPPASVSHHDKTFVKEAAEGGMAEVLDADLAIGKTGNADLKSFAQTMKADHTKANEQLTQLAQSKNIPLPTETTHHQTKFHDKLAKMSGGEFDKAYIDDQVKAHEDTIKLFQKEADKGQDADLKSFASTTLPTLQHHLEMAKNLQSALSGTASNH